MALLLLDRVLLSHEEAEEAVGDAGRSALPRPRQMGILWLFVVTTPLGILLGTVASQYADGPTARLLEGIFDGIAAGTFLYVATLEIGPAESPRRASARLAATSPPPNGRRGKPRRFRRQGNAPKLLRRRRRVTPRAAAGV
ncbi:MAG TPA: ZIP family metal transporter [Thermoanaerobaculia bacterium]|nr:ZIP family metal transporter [Thermoanaerobaculia bacterium]